ncbi:Pretoxin HINT domain-containing protein [Singulisphaera sp. GP187]|uniref:polymorphic toxin-type HINT domain-containing protein n=1 Tax=Singulisphaera sp. GP187 TaxID=1882752 RepID=UPI0009267DFD|nr:polymorphic toxin-type HINT domain-containing protein [Singulisphaera sp. GP187]SIO13096.1 Pretoxin HINT domain-containing protein [Singulisphaera sp. GP187]
MISTLLLGSALLTAGPGGETLTAPDFAAYETAKAGVGHDPDAHVRLALWCEAHGLQAERVRHLALAVLNDPSHAMARGLMGLVAYRGRWQRPETVGEHVKNDPALNAALAEYNARREQAAHTAEAQWRLALWCEAHGLKAEASAHLAAVVRLDPSRDAAWKRLGCKKHQGRWMTETQIAAEKEEREAQKKGDARWKPLLTRWRNALTDKTKWEEAERALAAVTDPYAVPSIWAVFVEGSGNERGQARAVQLLGQIDTSRASRDLALLAVFSDSAEVRRSATETLRGRDTREYLASVIALLRKRVKYEVRPVGGPGAPGVLFVAGERFNVQRLYAPPPMPNIPLFPGELVTYDPAGLPVIQRFLGSTIETKQVSRFESQGNLGPAPAAVVAAVQRAGLNPRRFTVGASRSTTTTETTTTPVDYSIQIPIGQLMLQYQTAALIARQQQRNDIQVVDDYNAVVGRLNDRATQVLRGVTGEDFGEDPQSWTGWWVDQLGYAYKSPQSQPVPTFVENIPLGYIPEGVATPTLKQSGPSSTTTSVSSTFSPGGAQFHHNCFKAGTPVRTLAGPRPIETIQVGDQVLTQDVQTGALSYQPVLVVLHNPPGATLRIALEGELEPIVATTIHRFWKAGQGWVMARDLQPGDPLRTLNGTARVQSVVTDQVQPVFNLQVAEGASFFVGAAGTLAHDNSLVKPVTAPFDAPPKLAALAVSAP